MHKPSIRSDMLARRRQLPVEICRERSRRIQKRLLALPEFREAQRLALYSPVRNEVATEEILRAAREAGKAAAFPRVIGQHLEFVLVTDASELEPGGFGIPEPRGSAVVPLGSLDLLVIPGVAFDLAGHRLGYGKGFYDRVLHDPEERGTLVGLCYEMQLIDSLPAGVHDVRMDLLVTENRVLRFGPHAAASRYPLGGGLT
jgi:5-formyltetrahydrofolate cyclo-ligase